MFTSFHNPLCDYTDRKPHGGISCFIRTSILHLIDNVNKKVSETIIIHFVGGHCIFGNYVVPADSPYFQEDAFSAVANRFYPKDSSNVVIGGGDLNARVGDINQRIPLNCSYKKNVDKEVNDSGRTIRSICASSNCFVINNMTIGPIDCDGDFTFKKGGRRSQNDLILTNKFGLSSVKNFTIHNVGWNPSDHTPVSVNVELDITNKNLAVLASNDIMYVQDTDAIKKPKKIQHERIDWTKYNTMVENDYYAAYDNEIQKLKYDTKLETLDLCMDTMSDSLYNCASTLTPQLSVNVDEDISSDPLIDLAIRTHSEWMRGECSTDVKDAMQNEVVEHLKRNAVSKERDSWAKVLQEKDTKAVWNKINWKGSFNNDTVSNKPTLSDLKDHFVSKGESVEDSTLLCDVTGDTFVPELDKEITVEEFELATNRLKDNSSGDGWAKKMITCLPQCIIIAILIMYNTIFFNHSYPTRWRTTLVNEIFKNKGNSDQAKNYRGISLVVLLSKVFDFILNNRFIKWFIPDDAQTAYQEEKSSGDHVFLIRCIVQQAKRYKRTLFIIAFDFDGAFDRVSRSLLIRKLIRFGAGVTFVACIASMYMCTDNIIFRNKEYIMFKLYSGIKQGLPLSPILFIFYINDIFGVFRSAHGKCVDDIFKTIHILIHADDVTLLATDRASAIAKLQTLCDYCKLNHIIPQITKCKFIVINGSEADKEPLPFGDAFLDNVDHLEILGSHISQSGSLDDDLELHMTKRFKSCIKFFNFCRENKLAPVSVRLKTLRACVMSSLLYNCETFGHKLPKRLETTYNKLIRAALQIRNNTPSLVSYIESGLLPIKALVEARQLKYFTRFASILAENSERKFVFDGLIDDPPPYLKHYLSLKETYNNHHELYKHHINIVKTKIRDLDVKGKSKYKTYLTINPDLETSPFIQCMHPQTTNVIRFRVGSHRLPIETGRWSRKKREERLCEECNVMGDEAHYVYNCSLVTRNDLSLENDLGRIWTQPDVFQLIKRLGQIDLL